MSYTLIQQTNTVADNWGTNSLALMLAKEYYDLAQEREENPPLPIVYDTTQPDVEEPLPEEPLPSVDETVPEEGDETPPLTGPPELGGGYQPGPVIPEEESILTDAPMTPVLAQELFVIGKCLVGMMELELASRRYIFNLSELAARYNAGNFTNLDANLVREYVIYDVGLQNHLTNSIRQPLAG